MGKVSIACQHCLLMRPSMQQGGHFSVNSLLVETDIHIIQVEHFVLSPESLFFQMNESQKTLSKSD